MKNSDCLLACFIWFFQVFLSFSKALRPVGSLYFTCVYFLARHSWFNHLWEPWILLEFPVCVARVLICYPAPYLYLTCFGLRPATVSAIRRSQLIQITCGNQGFYWSFLVVETRVLICHPVPYSSLTCFGLRPAAVSKTTREPQLIQIFTLGC